MGILDDVPANQCFYFSNGTVANNLYQLVDTLEHTDQSIFMSHVSSWKNDFSKWIREVIGDETLFQMVKDERERYWFIRKVRHRLEQLEKEQAIV